MDKALERLLDGFDGFRQLYLGRRRDLFTDLVENGQHPKVLLIGCSDSRVDPAILTGASPGEMFVVRNVAAIVPPYETDRTHHGTSSAIEFAVRGLEVEHIIVLGHAMCGGVRALADGTGSGFDFLGNWVALMAGVRDSVDHRHLSPASRQRAMELGCVLQSLRNLTTFPWIRERVERGEITLHGWFFDLPKGELLAFDAEEGYFAPARTRPPHGPVPRRSCGPDCVCAAMPTTLDALTTDMSSFAEPEMQR